ncbi:MAG: flagellar protein FlgN [Gammaproteobacteria bacterium]|nr:flagellar protein FlgN [Gammaproteobacteria bacterium]MCW8986496.1 flagellar protein FlgN [Gammaproteobacteria bacterium]
MMQDSVHYLSLENILVFTQDKMHQLLQVLKKETVLLEKNNIEALESITREKIILTEQIEKNEQQRIHFLTNKSLNANEPSQWLDNNKLISVWNKIKSLSTQAQKQNQINGLVINGSRRRIQAQIEILSTSAPAVELTYSASGENVKQRHSNTLARA